MSELQKGPKGPSNAHIFSRVDGDLQHFRSQVLDMGELACEQVRLGASAVAACDLSGSRRLRDNYRQARDLDIDLLQANINMLAIHHPVARDLRYVMMFSRTAYDLERIHREAVKLADIIELYAESTGNHNHSIERCELFDDINLMGDASAALLQQALLSVAEGDLDLGIEVIQGQQQIERIAHGSLRRLATYILQDPRMIQGVINATGALKGLERIADHAVSIATNLIFACSGKDVRHANLLNLNHDYLKAPDCV